MMSIKRNQQSATQPSRTMPAKSVLAGCTGLDIEIDCTCPEGQNFSNDSENLFWLGEKVHASGLVQVILRAHYVFQSQ